jgi:alcohol dehydrogenase (cytochrome c)
MTLRPWHAALVLLVLPPGLVAQGPLDPALLLKPPTDAWPSYHGDYTGRHYSPLSQVTVANARNLSLAWFYRTPAGTDGAVLGGVPPQAPAGPAAGRGGAAPPAITGPIIKAMPLMVNGILYLSAPNRVFAVDARTGRQIWQYLWRGGRGAIGNRGVGMYRNWLYVVTPDNNVVPARTAGSARRLTPDGGELVYGRDRRKIVLVGIGGDADRQHARVRRGSTSTRIRWKWY